MTTTVDTTALEEQLRAHKKKNTEPLWRVGLVAEVIFVLLIWEFLIGTLELMSPVFFPPPSAIYQAFLEVIGADSFISDMSFSLRNLVISLSLAAILGIVIGFAVGWFRLLKFTVSPLIWVLYATPKVALAPLIILAFGLGSTSKILLGFLLSFFPIVLNTIDGVETIDKSLVRAGRVFGLKGWRLGKEIILPATLPFVLVGVQRGVALGFVGVILGEFLGGSQGLGAALESATHDFRMDRALAIVFIMVVVANLGLVLVTVLRKWFAPWHDAGTISTK
jgi:ABC-type nitrate/sulfonate/bicarbonate transport system permease component